MPQAIVTAYHGPTNTRGSRVSAKCDAGRLSLPWDDALDSEGNHKAAARALITKLGWDDRDWVYGSVGRSAKGETFVPATGWNEIPGTGPKTSAGRLADVAAHLKSAGYHESTPLYQSIMDALQK